MHVAILRAFDHAGTGYQDGRGERSAKTTYSEWVWMEPDIYIANRTYVWSDRPWPVIEYVWRLRRDAWLFYLTTLCLPPILLAMLATSTFFMSPEEGERLGYGIAIYLASQFVKSLQCAAPRPQRAPPRACVVHALCMRRVVQGWRGAAWRAWRAWCA